MNAKIEQCKESFYVNENQTSVSILREERLFLAHGSSLSKSPYASSKMNPFTNRQEGKYPIWQFPFFHLPNSVVFGFLPIL